MKLLEGVYTHSMSILHDNLEILAMDNLFKDLI